MQITIVAVGTRGDVQPLTALAKGLQAAGHRVRVATNGEFAALVQAHGLDFVELSGSPTELMQGNALQTAMGGNKNPVTLIRGILAAVRPLFVQAMHEIEAACAGADLIVVSMLGFLAGQSVAEKLGVPCVEAIVLPGRPTRAFPSPLMGVNLRLGGTVNRLSHVLALRLGWMLFTPIVNHARAEALNLPPVALRKVIATRERNQRPVLHGYSPLVLPKPPDWSDWHHVTGYWFLERDQTWHPPADLVAFLAAGPPPVYVGFGSMTDRDAARLTQHILAALSHTGQRAVLSTGWGAISAGDLPDDVYQIDAVPHDWLFPQMAAVVHHGGSGTTSTGLRAGVPTIIVPFGGDQFLWGRQIHKMGIGPKPIPRKQITADRLAAAIRRVTTDEVICKRAAALGQRLRAEDGIGRAVAIIERMGA